MHKTISVLVLFFLAAPGILFSQILPKEGAVLNYRRVGFSYRVPYPVTKYKLEIAYGSFYNLDSFKKNSQKPLYTKASKVIAEVPSFAKDYTWRVVYTRAKDGAEINSALHHFSTGYSPEIDTGLIRLRVINPAVKYKDAYVFVDGNNVLYDMQGNPVWYYPYNDKKEKELPMARDLKLSPQGTITCMLNQHAFEINYDGDTLWKGTDDGAVSGEDSERYHHELTRLSNGHYMVLGIQRLIWNHNITPVDTTFAITDEQAVMADTNANANIKKTPFGTIIEYDEKGNLVWSWKSASYFMGSDVVNYMPQGRAKVIDIHENAFFFDEKDSVIYISYRNISRILKIKYPGGDVINTYGEIYKPGVAPIGNGMFSNQHAVKKTKDGYLYLYNNNPSEDSLATPKIVILKESGDGSDSLTKIWEYDCPIDGISMNQLYKKAREHRRQQARKNTSQSWKGSMFRFTSGGNVIELPDHSIFVCMNSQYSKLFIVSRDKKILWSATPERLNPGNKEWYLNPHLYRASIITPKELDNLIWNSSKK